MGILKDRGWRPYLASGVERCAPRNSECRLRRILIESFSGNVRFDQDRRKSVLYHGGYWAQAHHFSQGYQYMQVSPSVRWVLRLFNGPLQGAEFPLMEGRTLFVVGPEALFCDEQVVLPVPSDAIYIPMDASSNFEVLVEDNAVNGVIVRLLGSPAEERPIAAQTLEDVGVLRVAVRPEGEPWADALMQTKPLAESSWQRLPALPWQGLASLAVCVALVGLLAWWLQRPTALDDVQTLLRGTRVGMAVVPGRDGGDVYVFADSERDAGWGRQVLERNLVNRAHLVTRAEESSRLGRLLESEAPGFAWYRIDLADPSMPRVLFSNQRNLITPSFEARLTDRLAQAAPYARQVSLQGVDDALVSRLAQQGLERLALPFGRSNGRDAVTFTLQGSLADAELESARDFVSHFQQLWGDRYVHFTIELKDDWLKGKSFQYGPDGYVKLQPTSWYFPKP